MTVKVHRAIGRTGWSLVFTSSGRYYFWQPSKPADSATWTPPPDIHAFITDILPADLLEPLFDPDCRDYDWGNLEKKESSLREQETVEIFQVEGKAFEQVETVQKEALATVNAYDREDEGEFEELLRSHPDLNPFAPWSDIQAMLGYTKLPVKRQQAIFNRISAELCAQRRQGRERSKEDALTAWLTCLDAIKRPLSWTEFSRSSGARREWWWKQVDPKLMEKQFQERMTQLRNQQRVYKG